MDTTLLNIVLPVLFFFISFIYSSVGLGGGSSYTALMAIFNLQTAVIPMISLILNLVVTLIGSFNFIKNKHAKIRILFPFLISSIPMAYLGGSLKISREMFLWILLISLIFVAIRIYFWGQLSFHLHLNKNRKLILSLFVGALLGLLAGIVGIGGGIYLVPAIILLNLGTEKEAAACGSIFIWINSLAGLAARFQFNAIEFSNYYLLIIAVTAGGFLGSFMGSTKFSPRIMEKILGFIILIAIVLIFKTLLTTTLIS